MTNKGNANLTQINVIKLGKANCRPCQILTHVLSEESEEFAALNVNVIEKSIDTNPELIDQYGITSVPVLVFERNGHEMARIEGLVHIDEIYGAIEVAKTAK